jgi:hypothetical protein
MDRPSVYIETSIVSYLAARPSRDPVTLRNQRLTHEWWNEHRQRYALYTSRFVIDEAADGDQVVARLRLSLLNGIPLLASQGIEVEEFAGTLVARVPLPPQAEIDAVHIALAALSGMRYVVTWNCKHIANPRLRPRMEMICGRRGIELPFLCTPRELGGG